MKKFLLFSLVLLISSAFYSCSDDKSTTPEDTSTLVLDYPLAIDNEWIYEEVFTDHDGNVTEKSGNSESHKIGKTVNLFGKTGYEIIKTKIFAGADSEVDTTYMYDDETGIYMYDPKVSRNISEEFPELSVRWVKLVDFNKSSWITYSTVVDTTLSNGEEIKSYYTTTGKRAGTRNIVIQEKTFLANVFIITVQRASYTSQGIKFSTRTYEQLIIDKIGTYKQTEVETSGNGSWGLSLINYNI